MRPPAGRQTVEVSERRTPVSDYSTIIVVWGFMALASAAIAANIAYRRGLNDTAYFFAGLFLGIIGILAAAFTPLPPHWAPTRGMRPNVAGRTAASEPPTPAVTSR